METPAPAEIDEAVLLGLLAARWRLRSDSLSYVPKGFGSYKWAAECEKVPRWIVTVDDLDAKLWLGSDRETVFASLLGAYNAAHGLRQEAGLEFVVAPVPDREGQCAVRLNDRFSVAVSDFVAGRAGEWGDWVAPVDRHQVRERLGRLHRTSTDFHPVRVADMGFPGRAVLEAALDDLDRPWAGGPFSEPARKLLYRRAETLRTWVATFDRLASALADRTERVITHGEPHPGNLIWTRTGPVLIDWDTIGLALPERDLWMLDDDSGNPSAQGVASTDQEADDRAIHLYRLAWSLGDISEFVASFRSPHERTADTTKAWRVLQATLEERPPAPYGHYQPQARA
jgi:spectinomycin phosphotransferase